MKMMHDRFEEWVRDRSRGCLEDHQIDALCKADMDLETGEYVFRDTLTQAQWEAWQAAINRRTKK